MRGRSTVGKDKSNRGSQVTRNSEKLTSHKRLHQLVNLRLSESGETAEVGGGWGGGGESGGRGGGGGEMGRWGERRGGGWEGRGRGRCAWEGGRNKDKGRR